jgi:hypothetical protein
MNKNELNRIINSCSHPIKIGWTHDIIEGNICLWANGEYGRFIYNGIDYDAVLRFQSMDIESEREIRPQGANPFNWQPPIVAEGFTAFLLSKDLYIDENKALKIGKKYKRIRREYFMCRIKSKSSATMRKGDNKAFIKWNKEAEDNLKTASEEVLQYLWNKDYEDKTINERDFVKNIMESFIKSNEEKRLLAPMELSDVQIKQIGILYDFVAKSACKSRNLVGCSLDDFTKAISSGDLSEVFTEDAAKSKMYHLVGLINEVIVIKPDWYSDAATSLGVNRDRLSKQNGTIEADWENDLGFIKGKMQNVNNTTKI